MPDNSHAPAEYSVPKYMPAIDGLRAFAVLAVLIVHFPWMPAPRHVLLDRLHLQPLTQYGWVGVDLFFVISGFLITGILLDSKQSSHYFRNFYARRALRIWPLYYAVLCFVFVIYPLLHPHGTVAQNLTGWPYYLFYVQNFVFFDNGVPLLGVTWSLAIEEQFYITWPLIVLLCSRKRLRVIAATLLLASPVIRLVLDHTFGHYPTITFSRMDGILAGSLLALWFRSEAFSLAKLRKWASVLLVVGAAGSIYFLTTSRNAGQHSILVYSFLAIAFVGLVGFAAADSLCLARCTNSSRIQPYLTLARSATAFISCTQLLITRTISSCRGSICLWNVTRSGTMLLLSWQSSGSLFCLPLHPGISLSNQYSD